MCFVASQAYPTPPSVSSAWKGDVLAVRCLLIITICLTVNVQIVMYCTSNWGDSFFCCCGIIKYHTDVRDVFTGGCGFLKHKEGHGRSH